MHFTTRNGRWRSQYTIATSGSSTLTGTIHVDVHYYEDGNVRLLTSKPLSLPLSSTSATEVIKAIANAERQYQEDLNRAFTQLSEGAFKGLRRQLPVTRQKVEWEKIGGYRVGQSLQGAGAGR
jgi:capping protein alpha